MRLASRFPFGVSSVHKEREALRRIYARAVALHQYTDEEAQTALFDIWAEARSALGILSSPIGCSGD